jgi:hypothetical protein
VRELFWAGASGLLSGAMVFHVLNGPINGVTILGAAALALSIHQMRRTI